jgi:hypothetical protein
MVDPGLNILLLDREVELMRVCWVVVGIGQQSWVRQVVVVVVVQHTFRRVSLAVLLVRVGLSVLHQWAQLILNRVYIALPQRRWLVFSILVHSFLLQYFVFYYALYCFYIHLSFLIILMHPIHLYLYFITFNFIIFLYYYLNILFNLLIIFNIIIYIHNII